MGNEEIPNVLEFDFRGEDNNDLFPNFSHNIVRFPSVPSIAESIDYPAGSTLVTLPTFSGKLLRVVSTRQFLELIGVQLGNVWL